MSDTSSDSVSAAVGLSRLRIAGTATRMYIPPTASGVYRKNSWSREARANQARRMVPHQAGATRR
ncbi:hypothetical protein SHIRM173S_09422 [Streptomyces hirsutus]